jgi:O-antigen/teichoic acid export membrane protein
LLKILKYLGLIALPAHVGLALVAQDLISVVLSDAWQPIRVLLQMVCIASAFHVLVLPSHALLVARGRAGTLLKFHWISTGLLAAAFLTGTRFGLVGVGVMYLIVYPALRLVFLRLALCEVGLTLWKYLENVFAPLVAVTAMTVAVLVLQAWTGPEVATRLALSITAGGIAYVVALLLVDRGFGADVKGVVHELFAASEGASS